MTLSCRQFFSRLKWLDGRPLLQTVEPYRLRLFEQALDSDRYNLVLAGRSKKNWKSTDLVLAALYCLLDSRPGSTNQCYILANDLDQAGDDLALAKLLIECNPVLSKHLVVKSKVVERKDGRGFLMILPAGDIAGSHGKTYRFAGWDEIHGYKSWDLFEALQPDPHRTNALQWITSYASVYHHPGIPLYDWFQQGKLGSDPRMLFSWYAADYTTDDDLDLSGTAEERANPSRASWEDPGYLEQQQRRLPSHVYRRLHLNLPGLPEGSAFAIEPLQDSIQRGIRQRAPEQGIQYVGFVDMSGGSVDDATLGIAHLDPEGRAILDYLGHQGQRPPFDPLLACGKFAGTLKDYRISHVYLDRYAGLTFQFAFQAYGISAEVSLSSASEMYAAFEPRLNSHQVVLLDQAVLEQQLLGLLWKGGKITHPNGEHDDLANSAVGALLLALDASAPPGDDGGESSDSEFAGIPADELGGNFLDRW